MSWRDPIAAPPAEADAAILDLVHESIFVRNLDLTITFWNTAAERLYGWRREEAIGRHADDLLHCVHAVPLAEREAQLFETGRWEGEFERTTRTGETVIVEAKWSVSRDDAGRPLSVIETGRDVTERHKALDDIARSEAKYRNLFNYMPIAMWQLDSRRMREMFSALVEAGVQDIPAYVAEHPEFLDTAQATLKVTQANEQTIKLFGGVDREATLAAMPRLWLDRSDWVASNQARLAGKQSYSGESRIQTLDGRLVDVVFSVAFADPDNPESANTVGAIDVSELKATTAALAESELKYRDLFHHMPIALAQLDVSELIGALGQLRKDGVTDLTAYMSDHPDVLGQMLEMMRVEQVNEHTVRMFGGRDTAEFVGPITRFWRGSEETIRRSLAARFAGAEAYAEETRLRALDGGSIDVFYTSAFPKALSELGIGLVGMIDIGDRLQAERMLQKLQADFAHAARVATLGELTASIAHEVNQPLAAIATNGEASLRWLDRREPDIEEVRILSARIVADARRAADVIAHIRAMAARQTPVQQQVSLNAAVEDALGFLRNDLRLHGVQVEFEPSQDLPMVVVDQTQIQQVLVNLVVNAEQAMQREPASNRMLVIRTIADQRGRACVEVDDSGPGLSPEILSRLFDSFFTTKDNGLGLGLSICRSIIESHGGELRAENRADGGARFSFALPPAPTKAGHTKV